MNNALTLRDTGHFARDTRLVFELLENVHGGMLEIRLPDGSSRLFGEGEHGVTMNVHDEAMFSQVLARGESVWPKLISTAIGIHPTSQDC